MLSYLLKEENCFIKESVKDWKEAIHVACESMIEQGYCTQEYEKAIFDSTEEYGPYYVLCENLALIHASNHSGVNETQMAVTLLRMGIMFAYLSVLSQKTKNLIWQELLRFQISSLMRKRFKHYWMRKMEKKSIESFLKILKSHSTTRRRKRC